MWTLITFKLNMGDWDKIFYKNVSSFNKGESFLLPNKMSHFFNYSSTLWLGNK